MKKPAFMASVAFFIPLEKVGRKYSRDCKYTEIEKSKNIQTWNAKGEYAAYASAANVNLHYNSKQDNGQTIERTVQPSVFLFRYTQDKAKPFYLLGVQVKIDKVFDVNTNPNLQYQICTEKDLVNLKKAFHEDGKNGLWVNGNKSEYHKEWIKGIIKEIEGRDREVAISNSVINLYATSLDGITATTTDAAFDLSYYSSTAMDIDAMFTADDRRFVYGLLYGNDNYMRSPQKDVDDMWQNAFSNNFVEKTIAAPTTIIFLNTHYPYINVKNKSTLAEKLNIQKNQCLLEMFSALFLKSKFQSSRKILSKHDVKTILRKIVDLDYQLDFKIYQLQELDKKIVYIYTALGIYNEYNTLKKIGKSSAEYLNTEYSAHANNLIILLTAVTVIIGALQLYNDNFLNIKQIMNIIDFHIGGGAVVCILLVLILVCLSALVFIAVKTYIKKYANK